MLCYITVKGGEISNHQTIPFIWHTANIIQCVFSGFLQLCIVWDIVKLSISNLPLYTGFVLTVSGSTVYPTDGSLALVYTCSILLYQVQVYSILLFQRIVIVLFPFLFINWFGLQISENGSFIRFIICYTHTISTSQEVLVYLSPLQKTFQFKLNTFNKE